MPRPLVPALLQGQQPPSQEAGKEKVQSAAGLATRLAALGPADDGLWTALACRVSNQVLVLAKTSANS